MALKLSRKINDTVCDIRSGGVVGLAITAPVNVPIFREELVLKALEEHRQPDTKLAYERC
jgi:sRNA-binding carbon storage regulator CsrA